jgi:hypothetical protein
LHANAVSISSLVLTRRTGEIPISQRSLDHLVGEQLQRVGDGDAEGCCGLEINDEFVSKLNFPLSDR